MNLGSNIKSMLKEAELYRSQGLLNEAIQQYKAVESIIGKNENIKNRESLLAKIANKIKIIHKELDDINKPSAPPQVSEKVQNLMREMFSFNDPGNMGSAALGGAISLAEFGQYEKALEEFTHLLDYENLHMEAAKKLIRYGFKYQGADQTVERFSTIVKHPRFSPEEIATLERYFQQILKNAGIEKDLSRIATEVKTAEPESEIDDEDILDISAIRLILPKGPQKGDKLELDVNFQHGSQINLIVSQKEKGIVESLDAGDLINGVIFYSPVAIFSGTVHVLSKKPIGAGPKRGDFSINLKIVRIEAG